MVLKPLGQALRDNDIIRSVIVASGVNQDGKTSGITMPNGSAQGRYLSSPQLPNCEHECKANVFREPYEVGLQRG